MYDERSFLDGLALGLAVTVGRERSDVFRQYWTLEECVPLLRNSGSKTPLWVPADSAVNRFGVYFHPLPGFTLEKGAVCLSYSEEPGYGVWFRRFALKAQNDRYSSISLQTYVAYDNETVSSVLSSIGNAYAGSVGLVSGSDGLFLSNPIQADAFPGYHYENGFPAFLRKSDGGYAELLRENVHGTNCRIFYDYDTMMEWMNA